MFSSKNSLLDVWLGTEDPSGKKAFRGFNVAQSFNKIRYLVKRSLKLFWVPNFMKIGTDFKYKTHWIKTYSIYSFKTTKLFVAFFYHTKDGTYNKTKSLRDNKNIVILSGEKDSSIVIMNKKDYNENVEEMINGGIEQGKYEETEDNILKESFQSFLYRPFKDALYYK